MDEHSWYDEIPDYTKAEEPIPFVDYKRPKQEANQVSISTVPQPLDEKQSPASSAGWKPRRGSRKKIHGVDRARSPCISQVGS